jgi:hypothetical protein
MIRVTCPACNSKLNAKDEIAGQTRKCPKCAYPVKIVADAPPAAKPDIVAEGQDALPVPDLPERLNRDHHYLICDNTRLMATWENNGNGWMSRAAAGFLSAKRNRENLPAEGDFKLVELKFEHTPDGKRLKALESYQLALRWALTVLCQGDDQICGKITGPGALNREQKNAVRQALRDQFMRPVWQDAAEVLAYLGNADYHSPGVG